MTSLPRWTGVGRDAGDAGLVGGGVAGGGDCPAAVEAAARGSAVVSWSPAARRYNTTAATAASATTTNAKGTLDRGGGRWRPGTAYDAAGAGTSSRVRWPSS